MGRTQAQKRRDKKLYSERDEERTNSVSPSLLGHVEKKLKENMKELNLEIEKGKDKIKYQMRATKTKTTKTLRKLVTGEEDKKVRDFAKEKMRQRLTGDKVRTIVERCQGVVSAPIYFSPQPPSLPLPISPTTTPPPPLSCSCSLPRPSPYICPAHLFVVPYIR